LFGVSVLSVCEEMASEYVTDDSENESMSESMSCSSSSDQDNSEIVEDVLAGSYQPYAHEPLAETSDEDEQEEVDVDGIPLQEIEDRYEGIQTIENWCCCGHCDARLLFGPREYRCCHEIDAANVFKSEPTEPVQCVTEHPDFNAVVLHPRVLQVAANGLRTRQGKRYKQLGSDENSYLRAIAYRLFISMVFGFMGFDNSRPLPACAYTTIRTRFPKAKNTEYTGYKSTEER
jgi:hypothetical protein